VASASEQRANEADALALGEPRPLVAADLDRAVPAIARAFSWHEPFGEWAMPDPSDREERLSRRIEADISDRFLPEGECWTIGGVAVTLWIPPLSGSGTEALARRRSESDYASFGERADAMRAGDALISSLKPVQPHWYLDTIATAPPYHGLGLGGKLLDHNLEIRDAAEDACALDTHTPENIAFYERRGFEVIGEGPLGPGLSVYLMYRPPRPSRSRR